MALNAETIKNTYPLPVYNYRVEINGESIAFSEVSGLNLSYEVTIYRESRTDGMAGPRVMPMPGQSNVVTLSLKKGIVRGGVSVNALYKWMNTIQTNQVEKKDIRIRLCDEAGAPIINWTVINAFPTKLDAPTFDANSNDVAIESMELIADNLIVEES